mgnify:CR=1 FL=1
MAGWLEGIKWGASQGSEKGKGFGLLTPTTRLIGGVAGGLYGAVAGSKPFESPSGETPVDRQMARENRRLGLDGPSEQQQREYATEQRLRQDAWRAADQLRGAVARDQTRKAALGYDPSLWSLQDMDIEAPLAQTDVESAIFKQETSATAKREERIAWVMQQIQSMMAAGVATKENIAALGPLSGGDPQVAAVIQNAAMNAPGKPTLGGDLGELVVGYGYGLG